MNHFSHISASPITWPPGWPRARSRRRAKFNTGGHSYGGGKRSLTVSDAVDRINTELRGLGVRDGGFIVSTNLQLRNDGLPRSGQGEPSDPAAAVYWRTPSDKTEKVMAIDHYDRVADNLAAIAATLEALRAIERHGGGQILERAFTGFTALPPPMTTPAPPSCWKILGIGEFADDATIEAAWRGKVRECRSTHPGGDHPREADINSARDVALKINRDGEAMR
jgi:hypothetical protein